MKLNTVIRKKFRVSNKLKQVAPKDRLRLSIMRSSKNIFAQIIDDTKNKTLLSELRRTRQDHLILQSPIRTSPNKYKVRKNNKKKNLKVVSRSKNRSKKI